MNLSVAPASTQSWRQRSRTRLKSIIIALAVVGVTFALYMVKPDNIQPADAIWAPHVTASLIYDGDPFLDEYRQWIDQWEFYAAVETNGKIYPFFPLGGQVLAIPQTILLDALLPQLRATTVQEYLQSHSPIDPFVLHLQLINAALLVALSAGVMFLIGREYLNVPFALLLAATYAFATSAYSTASRAMWQHGPSMLMLTIALFLLVKARKRPALISFVSLPLAVAFIIRPTNAVSVLIITIYVLIVYRKHFLSFAFVALLPAIPFILSNLSLYGRVLPPYFSSNRLGSPFFLEALLGNVISPARGVLVFSPVLLLAGLGLIIKWRKFRLESLDFAALAILILHWVAISSFFHWWGGHSFGPRLFSDVMPFAVYFLIPTLQAIQSSSWAAGVRLALGAGFALLLAVSIAIHYRGATSLATFGWNSVPITVDVQPARIWDWSDLQFLRGLGKKLFAVAPEQLIVASASRSHPQRYSFQLGSMTDGPVDLTMILPSQVKWSERTGRLFESKPIPGGGTVERLSQPLTGLGMRDFEIEIDATNSVSPGNIVGIQLVGSQATVEETKVIALSFGPYQEGMTFQPPDIQIKCAPPGSGELSALFGAGWYEEEAAGDSTWRWASSPAYFFVWADERQQASIEMAISSLYVAGSADGLGDSGVFHITLPDGAETRIGAQSNQPLQFDAPLQRGWNTLIIELESGNFRPTDRDPGHFDARELSFSVDAITLTGACRPPAIQPTSD